ncbi:MAG: TetR/AcrR family transcriptional regulator [Gordonia sp. (in: high G+C Gram-positive bacteria)]|uniref:TetR/AcrR family transcriptional regulator n=1 Tax=Gordonia sp. (in: high G+C Gram-positive bacteria) TaxID=84139 RepID=UPI003C71DD43
MEQPPHRKRMRAPQRREQIVVAARTVFTESGHAGARISDIAAEAGINEALVYRHFESKEQLFQESVIGRLDEVLNRLVNESGDPPPEFDEAGEAMYARTLHYVKDLVDALIEVGPLLGVVFFGDSIAAATYVRERISPFMAQVAAVVEANLQAWPHRDFDPAITTEATFGAVWFHTTVARLEGRVVDRDNLATSLTTMMIDGLRSRNL